MSEDADFTGYEGPPVVVGGQYAKGWIYASEFHAKASSAALLSRVEEAGTSGDQTINDAIYKAADVLLATGGNFGQFGEDIPVAAKDVIEAFLAALVSRDEATTGGDDA